MNSPRLLLAVTALAFAFLFTFAVPTAIAKHKTAPGPPDTRKLIQSVDLAAGTIVIKSKSDKLASTYTIDDATTIKVNDASGKMSDIKVGMEVSDYVERDTKTLDSISVKDAGSEPAEEE